MLFIHTWLSAFAIKNYLAILISLLEPFIFCVSIFLSSIQSPFCSLPPKTPVNVIPFSLSLWFFGTNLPNLFFAFTKLDCTCKKDLQVFTSHNHLMTLYPQSLSSPPPLEFYDIQIMHRVFADQFLPLKFSSTFFSLLFWCSFHMGKRWHANVMEQVIKSVNHALSNYIWR